MTGRLLVVDDEDAIRRNLSRYFRASGFDVATAGTGAEALAACQGDFVDVVFLDLRLPDMDGLDVLDDIKARSPQTSVIVITAHGDVDTAVRAMHRKADNFLLKPVDLEALEAIVAKQLEQSRVRSEMLYLKGRVSHLEGFGGQHGPRFPSELLREIKKLAQHAKGCILIQGETGVGKGVAARMIHEFSPQSGGPFVDLNCAALSPEFLESELFGHTKGAFTDAKETKRGLLEVANGGTLLLDEVGELSLPVQAKLLKVIEEKTFRRLGSTHSLEVEVRILASTNDDLEKAVSDGRFRKDLFFRLNGMPLAIQPLRERRGEIMDLAADFLREYGASMARSVRGFSEEARQALADYDWPGNIRELRNVVERAVFLCEEDVVQSCHLPTNLNHTARSSGKNDSSLSLQIAERNHIAQVLKACDGNRTVAARQLGLHRSTLIRKIQKYGL